MKNKQENLEKQIISLTKEKQGLVNKNDYLEVNQKLLQKEYNDAKENEWENDFNITTQIIMPRFSDSSLLTIACGKGNFKLVKHFVSTGKFNILDNHSFCLQCACHSGNLELVKYIIQFNTNNITTRTIINLIFF